MKHFTARLICLMIVPAFLYTVIFYVHMSLLCHSGSGDGFFSSAFQSLLQGNPLYNVSMPHYVAYGSVVTLKSHRTGGTYLHSHPHLYPDSAGAAHQQVTAYSHRDDNNLWKIIPVTVNMDNINTVTPDAEPQLLYNGSYIRLEHVLTACNLRSHKVPAPLTRRHYQVSCYRQRGNSDRNDIFRVESITAYAEIPLSPLHSVFKLIHNNTGCILNSHDKQLPLWAWEQMEVTCARSTRRANVFWNIEQLTDSRLENGSLSGVALGFFGKFVEFHTIMFRGNSGLKPKEDEVISQPWQWPLNFRGQTFAGPNYRVYLLGNPVIWWSCLVVLLMFIITSVSVAIICKHHSVSPPPFWAQRFSVCSWLLLAWLWHYVPLWFMGRILYFHHYFPAQLFSVMLTAIFWDSVIIFMESSVPSCWSFTVRHVLKASTFSVIIYSFYLFCPLSYGMTGPMSTDSSRSIMHRLRWLDSWDI